MYLNPEVVCDCYEFDLISDIPDNLFNVYLHHTRSTRTMIIYLSLIIISIIVLYFKIKIFVQKYGYA